MAAKIVAEIVRSTIGPRGMDKMLVAGMGDIVITNDGATIMKEMDVQNPAAKMIVEISKTQDSEVGDAKHQRYLRFSESFRRACCRGGHAGIREE